VDSLAFGVRRGERFGLLGVNGAGKSTTLAALRGDVRPSGGRSRVLGFDCAEETEEARRAVGYCPQFDPLLEFLTGRETVEMHARLKGGGASAGESEAEASESSERVASSDDAVTAADRTLAIVGLSAFADRPCGEYSGGNKRKLTLAMALVGRPRVLLLDEPSSGMCPLGRRMMWDAIERAARGLTVVLTTHAMDECEALCDRVGIVADGRLRCVGTAQHLKARFGDGFRVEAKLARGEGADERGRALAAKLASAAAEDAEDEKSERGAGSFSAALALAPGRVRVRVATRDALAEAFSAAERARAEGVVEHYAVTQTTLEDVFATVSGGREEGEEVGGREGG
jgi:ABC-type multidrug transport system ATPase subunit